MAALSLLGVVVAFVQLDGTTSCPAPEQVAAELRGLLRDDGHAAREQVTLVDDAGALVVELRDAGGTVARRRLEPASCEELAKAAAVVIAAWATELLAAGPAKVELPAPRRRRPLGWEVAGGFVASFAGASFAPGGALSATLGPKGGRVHGRVAVTAAAARDLAVGAAPPAHATFLRAALWLGPLVRFRPGRWLLDLHADAGLSLLRVEGVGFPGSRSAFDADVGLDAGARAAVHAGPVAPFLGVSVQGWLRPIEVSVSGPAGGRAEVPRLEVLLSAGLAFGND